MKIVVVTVAPNTPIKAVARFMAETKIGCAPLIGAGIVVGLVTTTNTFALRRSLGVNEHA